MSNVPVRKAWRFHPNKLSLLVVIALISVLTARGLVQYRTSVAAAREAVLKADLLRMRGAIHQYAKDKGKYPSTLAALVADGYLRTIPQDPITRSTDTWTTTRAGLDPSNSSRELVNDVRSGAQGSALDGSKYSEW
jgi:general secretion pathway protein G